MLVIATPVMPTAPAVMLKGSIVSLSVSIRAHLLLSSQQQLDVDRVIDAYRG
jgi:hypothetical protein